MDIFGRRILSILKESKQDITIQEIADKLSTDRHTASKHLKRLEKTNLIKFRLVGKSKLYKLSENPITNQNSHVSIQSDDFSILWHNEKAKKRKQAPLCYEAYAGKTEKCVECPIEKSFITGESHEQVIDWPNRRVTITSKPIKNEKNETIAVVEMVKHNGNH